MSAATLTQEQTALLKKSSYPDVPDAQFELFVATCNRTGLDPFARQIYMVARKAKDQRTQEWITKYEIQTSIDGLRVVAERTGSYQGQDGPYWCGADGKWTDVWLQKSPPLAAKLGVLKLGFIQPLWSVAKWESYAQRNREGQPTPMWAKMPDLMLGKCAEALALRRAFPNDLGGLYTGDEMSQATNAAGASPGPQTSPPAQRPPASSPPASRAQSTPSTQAPALAPPHEAPPPDLDDYLSALPPSGPDPLPPSGPGHMDDERDPQLDFDEEQSNVTEQPKMHEVDAYRIPFGKFTGKSIRQVGVRECLKYLEWLETSARAQDKPMSQNSQTFRIMVIRAQQLEHGR